MEPALIVAILLVLFFAFVLWQQRKKDKEPVPPPLTDPEREALVFLRRRTADLEQTLLSLYQDLDETEARERGVTVHHLWLEGRNIFINRNS